ncbi:MAG: hypothetical protein JSR97_07395 [Verrucomicrobia bacterium]|jgi:hypothetical protein|nr:hypothetical protein [Verrucomicrobiota bacterium]
MTLFAFSGALTFAFICVMMYLLDQGQAIFLLLYTPGLFFGIAMFFALKSHSNSAEIITVLSVIEYVAMIFFCSKDYGYLEVRRILMGGIGALIFLATVIMTTELRLTVIDFVLGFVLGILTTLFMWTDNFQWFDPWLTILSVIAWQTTIAAVINRRIIITGVTRLKMQEG